MNAQKFRYVMLALIVLTLGAAAGAGYFGLDMLHERVAEAETVKVDADVNIEASLYAERAQQQLENPEIAKLSEYLAEVIPENSYRNQFIADVNKYAADSGIPLSSLSFAEEDSGTIEPPVAEAEAVPIQLQLGENVPYGNFISFVKKLENNLQQVQVLSINLQPNEDNRSILQSPSLTVALYVEPSDG